MFKNIESQIIKILLLYSGVVLGAFLMLHGFGIIHYIGREGPKVFLSWSINILGILSVSIFTVLIKTIYWLIKRPESWFFSTKFGYFLTGFLFSVIYVLLSVIHEAMPDDGIVFDLFWVIVLIILPVLSFGTIVLFDCLIFYRKRRNSYKKSLSSDK